MSTWAHSKDAANHPISVAGWRTTPAPTDDRDSSQSVEKRLFEWFGLYPTYSVVVSGTVGRWQVSKFAQWPIDHQVRARPFYWRVLLIQCLVFLSPDLEVGLDVKKLSKKKNKTVCPILWVPFGFGKGRASVFVSLKIEESVVDGCWGVTVEDFRYKVQVISQHSGRSAFPRSSVGPSVTWIVCEVWEVLRWCGVVLRCGDTLGDDGVGYSTGFDSDKINKHSRGISMVFRKLQKRKNQRKKCVHEFELDTLLWALDIGLSKIRPFWVPMFALQYRLWVWNVCGRWWIKYDPWCRCARLITNRTDGRMQIAFAHRIIITISKRWAKNVKFNCNFWKCVFL